MEATHLPEPQFVRTLTILPVRDIAEAAAWYERALGFQTVYLHEGASPEEATNFATLDRDGVHVSLILDEPPPYAAPWTKAGVGHLHLVVRDVDAAFSEVEASGVAIARGLATENWGARGFDLTDPSGNSIHIEQGE